MESSKSPSGLETSRQIQALLENGQNGEITPGSAIQLLLLLRSKPMSLADRLDLHYAIYQLAGNEDSFKDERNKSEKFLKTVLDIQDQKDIERLMAKRLAIRDINPDFIPYPSPSFQIMTSPNESAHFDNNIDIKKLRDIDKRRKNQNSELNDQERIQLHKKLWHRFKNYLNLLIAINYHEKVMRANAQSKTDDSNEGKVFYENALQRDAHRVVIYQGKFLTRGTNDEFVPADTRNNVGHGLNGYAGFVIGPEGEINLFDHLGEHGNVAHSAWTNQGLAFAAGLIKIQDGKLLEIIDHSGHYKPNSVNNYELLQYFISRGVDVSQVMMTVQAPQFEIPQKNSSAECVKVYGDNIYSYAANEYFQWKNNQYLNKYLAKPKFAPKFRAEYNSYREIQADLIEAFNADQAKLLINSFQKLLEEMAELPYQSPYDRRVKAFFFRVLRELKKTDLALRFYIAAETALKQNPQTIGGGKS